MAKAKSSAYRAGLKVRRRWLGRQYVDKAFREADDFTQIFIHVATYAGAPAAMDSFRIAKRILAEKR